MAHLIDLKKRNNLKSRTQRFGRDETGNLAIMTALALTVFVGCLAVAVDLSTAYSARSKLQDTTDAIALLAVKENLKSKTELNRAAEAYLKMAYDGEPNSRVTLENISRTGDRVNVQASNNIQTQFSTIFGRNTLDVGVLSQAVYDNKGLNLALVLDTTGSMSSGTKIKDLKSAANLLIDRLDSQNNDAIRVSVVPFAQYVNVGTSNKNKSWIDNSFGSNWQGCVSSRSGSNALKASFSGKRFPTALSGQCPTSLLPLTSNMKRAKAKINSMQPRGWTYMPAGLSWGWRTISASEPFTEASRKAAGISNVEKVIVLMSDGANTRSVQGETHEGWDVREANKVTEKMCETINRERIKVYTIAFQLSSSGTDNTARKVLKDCATTTSDFFDTSNASELNAAFDNIAKALIQPRITA